MYIYSHLSDTDNCYIAVNVKSLIGAIQRDGLIKFCHTERTREIILLYAFQSIVAGPKIWKISYSEKRSH